MKPWLETWTYEAMYRRVETPGGALVVGEELVADAYPQPDDGARMQLAAAAPALVRALLAVEWDEDVGHCHACRHFEPSKPGEPCNAKPEYIGHASDCPVDAALTAAGLQSRAERDAARKDIVAR